MLRFGFDERRLEGGLRQGKSLTMAILDRISDEARSWPRN